MLPLSGVVALSEPDPEIMAMVSRAAENVGLMWNPPPCPDPSRVDEWFLVPLHCHSSWKCMRSSQDHGRHILLPETNLVAPPPSPTSMVGPLWGTAGIPSVERSVAMQLYSTAATTLWGDPCHGVTVGPPGQSLERPTRGWSRPCGST